MVDGSIAEMPDDFGGVGMKSKVFGTLVAGAVTGLMLGTPAMAKDKKEHPKKEKGACTSNECSGKVAKADGTAATNTCKGQTVEGVTKAECTKEGHGTWK